LQPYWRARVGSPRSPSCLRRCFLGNAGASTPLRPQRRKSPTLAPKSAQNSPAACAGQVRLGARFLGPQARALRRRVWVRFARCALPSAASGSVLTGDGLVVAAPRAPGPGRLNRSDGLRRAAQPKKRTQAAKSGEKFSNGCAAPAATKKLAARTHSARRCAQDWHGRRSGLRSHRPVAARRFAHRARHN
jgi:hypothetical protein